MIYTSYFGNIRNLPQEKCVSVSRGDPKWYAGAVAKYLAPSWALMKEELSAKEFTERYKKEVLGQLRPENVAKWLDGFILLCWEPVGEFCHRRLIAEWIENGTGIVVPEWVNRQVESEKVSEIVERKSDQLEFF